MHNNNWVQKCVFNTPMLWAILCTLIVTLLSAPSFALDSDRQQPIQIEAQQAEFNPDTGIAVYTGQVLMVQGSLRIVADQVTIYQNAKNEVEKVVATAKNSQVHMQQQPKPEEPLVHAYAHTIEYRSVEQEMLLQQNARLENGLDQFTGNQIRYHLQTRHIKAWGGDDNNSSKGDTPQVKIILYPKTDNAAQDNAQ